MKPIDEMSLGELAAYIDTHLKANDINVVLSGGASVAIHSEHLYVSKDLDFIAQFSLNRKKVESVMKSLGFEARGKYFYHSDSPYFVEFIPGPPAIGREPIEEIHEIKLTTGTVRVISPTDSVKDRLAAFYHWGDQQSLEQAILVCKTNLINLENVKAWSVREGKTAEYELFIQRLEKNN